MMTIDDIKDFVDTMIVQSIEGFTVENNKVDFKRQWYNFKDQDDLNEFLKDTTAIANAYGGGDGFLIIGYDEKQKCFVSSPMSAAGIKNDSDLLGIIKRKVDRPFNIQVLEHTFSSGAEDHLLSIIHLPPSLDKPHVIREYKKGNQIFYNEIFVRKDRNCERASKADLDLMYAEKPALQVERKALFTFRTHQTKFKLNFNEKKVFLTTHVAIENAGFKPIAINSVQVIVTSEVPFHEFKKLTMPLHSLREHNGFFPIIAPNDIARFTIDFFFVFSMHRDDIERLVNFLNQGILERTTRFDETRLILSSGEVLLPRVTMVDY